jgi:hypothetical protein
MDTKDGIEDVKTSKLSLSIDKATIDKLSSAGLFVAYNAIRAKALEDLGLDANSVLLTVDCAVVSETNIKADIDVSVVSGLKSMPLPCGVQTNDYWRTAKDAGKCDGTNQGKEAAWRAEQILNLSYCQISPCNVNQQWQPFWLTQVVIPYTFNTGSLLNMYWADYTVFPSGDYTCLDPTKMQQLVNNLKNIKANYLQQYFPVGSGYTFLGLSVEAVPFMNGDIPFTFYNGLMLYGRGACIPLPDGEIPRDE